MVTCDIDFSYDLKATDVSHTPTLLIVGSLFCRCTIESAVCMYTVYCRLTVESTVKLQ